VRPAPKTSLLSVGADRGCCEPALPLDPSAEFTKAHGPQLVHDSVGLLLPIVRWSGDLRRKAERLRSNSLSQDWAMHASPVMEWFLRAVATRF
jgi:hypothetical protein